MNLLETKKIYEWKRIYAPFAAGQTPTPLWIEVLSESVRIHGVLYHLLARH